MTVRVHSPFSGVNDLITAKPNQARKRCRRKPSQANKEFDVMSLLAKTRLAVAGSLAGLAVLSATAFAEPVVRMDVDTVRLVKLAGQPATVVLSNPLYADATIQGDRLVLIGKNTGRTNVIVLDLDGNQLANFLVKVQRDENQVVSIYRAGQRRTLQCEPFCDDVLVVNDDAALFKNQLEQITGKTGLATGGGGGAGGGAQ
jgi:Flp pilus assembly secretin CpaC